MAHITTIGDPGNPSSIERMADMNWPRGFTNAVVLPDGTVLVFGGQYRSVAFTDTEAVMTAELLDACMKRWTKMATMSVPRTCHSVSLLLAGGRVRTGGGGLYLVGGDCNQSTNHADGRIYSPPYLFTSSGADAQRPGISSISSTASIVGSTITVTMSDTAATKFSLVRVGSATHSINSDQRRVSVTSSQCDSTHTITLPSDSGVLIPFRD